MEYADGPPSPLDESKLLLLAGVLARSPTGNAALEDILEKVLFYVMKHASHFFHSLEHSFVESLLETLSSVASMRRPVVDTVIGIFKKMASFECLVRALALQKLSRFMSKFLLAKDFLLHPSAPIVAEVLVRHVQLHGYQDYDNFRNGFKTNLVYHALLGLRAVVNTHLLHSPGRSITRGGDFAALIMQCASVSCTLLQGGRPFDRHITVEVEAVRLLLNCARVEPSLYAAAYHVKYLSYLFYFGLYLSCLYRRVCSCCEGSSDTTMASRAPSGEQSRRFPG